MEKPKAPIELVKTPAKAMPVKASPANAKVTSVKVTPTKDVPATPPAKAPPAKAPPAKVLPLHVEALGLVPDAVDELPLGALTVTDNAKTLGECENCKKKYKNEGAWYQLHIEGCGKVGHVDPPDENDDTLSDGGTGMG